MTRPVPRMASDLVRIWLSAGIGFAVSMAFSIGWAFLALRNDVPLGRSTAIIVSTLGLIIVSFAVHQILTWRLFASLGRQELRDVVCRTNPRSQIQRWFNLVSGNGPKSWSLVAPATALIVVVLVIVNTELRSNPVAIGASGTTVARAGRDARSSRAGRWWRRRTAIECAAHRDSADGDRDRGDDERDDHGAG